MGHPEKVKDQVIDEDKLERYTVYNRISNSIKIEGKTIQDALRCVSKSRRMMK